MIYTQQIASYPMKLETRTQRDRTILRKVVRFLARQYRASPTRNTASNIAMLYAQRRHVTYGNEVLPVPRWL